MILAEECHIIGADTWQTRVPPALGTGDSVTASEASVPAGVAGPGALDSFSAQVRSYTHIHTPTHNSHTPQPGFRVQPDPLD